MGRLQRGLYHLEGNARVKVNSIKTSIDARTLHHRLGHIPVQKLKEVFGFNVPGNKLGLCDA